MSDDEMQDAPSQLNERLPDGSLPYDPDQPREERRQIRKQYRRLHENDGLNDPASVGINDLTEGLQTADLLFQKVKGPQEATLDSSYLFKASNVTAAKARQMKSDTGAFDIDDFIAKLITFMGGRRQGSSAEDGEAEEDGDAPLDWEKIGRKALAKSRRVPAMDFMLGPLAVEQKKRAVVKRNKVDKEAEQEAKPQELKEEDIQRSENETTKNVAKLKDLLETLTEPVNLFRFIVNPDDFGQTVENLFYLSFLIRDGQVSLEIRETDRQPIIFPCNIPTDDDYANGLKKQQMVLELDMETWEHAKKVFNITTSMIPSRQPAKVKLGDKWYG